MLRKRNWSLLLIMTLVLSMFLAACAGGSSDSEEDKNSNESDTTTNENGSDLVIATLSDAAKLDPHLTTDVPSYNVLINMFDGLVKKDKDDQIVENLATNWEIIDDTTWVFELRDDVTFHDGEAFNAEVVKKNFERILDENIAAPRAFIFEMITDIEVLDEYKVQITTEFPFAPLLAHLSHPVGAMVSPKSIDEDYAAMEEGKEPGSVINAHPIGTGFFKFDKWDHGTEVKLVKNDNYWGQEVQLNSVTFKAIPEGGTRLAELETGYAHLIEPVQPSEVVLVEDSDNAFIDERLSSSLAYVGFNLEKEPFDNKLVRQAVTMLISQNDIIEGIYEGHGLAATGPLAPGVFGHAENLKPLPHDPDKALELLKEAGYEDGFKTTIWTNDNQQRMDMAVLIQEALKQANIEVDIEIVEWGAYLDKTANGEHDMFILGLTNPVGDADYFLSQLFHSENKGVSGNRTFYENPEVDKLLVEARQEIDENKRQELYTTIQEILIEDAPMMYVHHQAYLSGVSNSVENYWIDPSGYYKLQDVTFKE
ncbi:glutathione ABC transporter substrate-binding protein [Sporosarcina ureilytica]|uniref:Glutathione ABC transporter substrate-binding protein n=1 Tax=Sporosarcina ureilytica TaxID=298596 RepID=A0A1D8JID0_9BACL|nr:glutathione ABC transporter substrate-binding protein [Sporosarcina ureilytica]AOV08468.1 glutathione ABC transporter substrate-binding protein [Sporosarcina ureilytica]